MAMAILENEEGTPRFDHLLSNPSLTAKYTSNLMTDTFLSFEATIGLMVEQGFILADTQQTLMNIGLKLFDLVTAVSSQNTYSWRNEESRLNIYTPADNQVRPKFPLTPERSAMLASR
jgi:hypothetical protein